VRLSADTSTGTLSARLFGFTAASILTSRLWQSNEKAAVDTFAPTAHSSTAGRLFAVFRRRDLTTNQPFPEGKTPLDPRDRMWNWQLQLAAGQVQRYGMALLRSSCRFVTRRG
jgi:hypothetical protein